MVERVLGSAAHGLSECIGVGVLEADGDNVAFRHELARDAVLGNIDPARRRDLNRLALEALGNSGSRRTDLALLVQYAAGAGDAGAVLEYGVPAARAAAAVGAHRQAAAHYARVMAHAGDRPAAERAGYCEAYAEECAIVDELPEAERGRASGARPVARGGRPAEGRREPRRTRLAAGARRPQRRCRGDQPRRDRGAGDAAAVAPARQRLSHQGPSHDARPRLSGGRAARPAGDRAGRTLRRQGHHRCGRERHRLGAAGERRGRRGDGPSPAQHRARTRRQVSIPWSATAT